MEELKEKGLVVGKTDDGMAFSGGCWIIAPKEKREMYVFPRDGKWILDFWHCTPGPGENDFRYYCSSLDEVKEVVLEFYFGQTTLINTWVVPLHRHPELDLNKVELVIHKAETIQRKEFKQIQQQLDRLQESSDDQTNYLWPKVLEFCFLEIHNVNVLPAVLYLRRDASIAYVVPN